MAFDLSKSLVHSAEHFRTIIFPVTAAAIAGTSALELPTIPDGSIYLGVSVASSGDETFSNVNVLRTYTSSFTFGDPLATGDTVTATDVGNIVAAKDINLALTFFSPAGL